VPYVIVIYNIADDDDDENDDDDDDDDDIDEEEQDVCVYHSSVPERESESNDVSFVHKKIIFYIV
jgi:hypothetical protein